MKRLLPLIIVMLSLCSCETVDRVFHSIRDPKVASVGKNILYRSELEKVIPSGVAPEDSLMMAEQYIRSWALGKLLLAEADARLSTEQKTIDDQVAEFRHGKLRADEFLPRGVDVLARNL